MESAQPEILDYHERMEVNAKRREEEEANFRLQGRRLRNKKGHYIYKKKLYAIKLRNYRSKTCNVHRRLIAFLISTDFRLNLFLYDCAF